MLCLTRKVGQTIEILHNGERMRLTVIMRGKKALPVMLGFEGPHSFRIIRGEHVQTAANGAVREIDAD